MFDRTFRSQIQTSKYVRESCEIVRPLISVLDEDDGSNFVRKGHEPTLDKVSGNYLPTPVQVPSPRMRRHRPVHLSSPCTLILGWSRRLTYGGAMCRNITMLRGLEPPATHEEIHAAALQYARKVAAVTSGPLLTSEPFVDAVREIADVTERLLAALPARRSPPPQLPPMRRRALPNA